MSKPLVSVIVPCYNAAGFLPALFKCFDRQTYKNIQPIFVDDGSTDATLDLIKQYCSAHPDSVFITGENVGSAAARNRGLEMIGGELFAFCDADDLFLDDHFNLLVKFITENEADMAVCGIKRVDGAKAGKIKLSAPAKVCKTRTFNRTQALEQYFSQEVFDFPLYNKIYRTAVLKKSGARFLEDSRYGEESYFIYKYLSNSVKTVYYGAKTYVYLQNKSSLMHVGFKKSRLDVYKNLREVMAEITANKDDSVLPYVSVMRAGYSVGILHFILHSEFRDGGIIAGIVLWLKKDVKSLKKAKKVAFYKKALLPACAVAAGLVFNKYIKKYAKVSGNSANAETAEDALNKNDYTFIGS